jgi:hypothetical protein
LGFEHCSFPEPILACKSQRQQRQQLSPRHFSRLLAVPKGSNRWHILGSN